MLLVPGMARLATILGLLATIAVPVHALDDSVAGRCPAYIEHLRVARTYLSRGARAQAVTELRHAEDALQSCLHQEEATGPPRVGCSTPGSVQS